MNSSIPDVDASPAVSATAGVRSVARASQLLLETAARSRDGATLKDLVAATGLSKSTCYRLLLQLVESGLLVQEESQALFFPSPSWITLGAAATNRHGWSDLVYPAIESISRQTEDTSHFFIRDGDHAICAGMIIGSYPVKSIAVQVGERRPLGLGSASLALMSALPEAEIQQLLEQYRDHPPVAVSRSFSAAQIEDRVREAQVLGYALNDGMIVGGMTGLGVPVRSPEGVPIMSLSIAAITERLAGERRELVVRILKQERDRLEAQLSAVLGRHSESAVRLISAQTFPGSN